MSENTIRLHPGDIAPDFTLNSASGASVTLSEVLKDHDRVVVYFYPAAMTPGCTTKRATSATTSTTSTRQG